MFRRTVPLVVVGFVALIAVGCGRSDRDDKPANPPPAVQPGDKGDDHAHKPGKHGGLIVSIGRDNYHAEAIFEKGGVLRLLMLDRDEARILEVEEQTPTAYLKRAGEVEAQPFPARPEPQQGDGQGKTSQFVVRFPAEWDGERLDVTIPVLKIGGERFRIGFKNYKEGDAHADAMPDKVAGADERQLYLTPGGKYTEEDVKANGSVTASQKFKGQMAAHDLNPKKGEKICPITLTKASAKFTWVVAGKTYEFCCPPCVDEFVRMAKEQPEEVKEPGDYVKK